MQEISKIKRLVFFDFDGTLFNTPLKPQNWKGGWWGKDSSLTPPFIPHHSELKEKGRHLINNKVAEAYFENKDRKDTHTVMMTGRHWGLRKSVMNIMYAFDLSTKQDYDDLVEESNRFIFISGGNTLAGKLQRITELFKEFYAVELIEMWEDREEHMGPFRDHAAVLKRIRPNFKGIIVHEPPNWE